MKFVPRPPQSTQRLPSRTTTTRFLRLQATDDDAAEKPAASPRPLPTFSDLPRPKENRTASQRVRLYLDPEIATKPLPNAAQLLREPLASRTEAVSEPSLEETPGSLLVTDPAPAAVEPVAEPAPEPVYQSAAEEIPQDEFIASAPEPVAEEASGVFEIPAQSETVHDVWVPPGPGQAEPSTWLPPVTTHPFIAGDVPTPVEEPVPEEPSIEAPVTSEESAAAPAAAYESRRLERPKLRRVATPLAEIARPEQSSLGRGFWILLALLILALLALLYIFALAPRITALQAQARVLKTVPARPVTFIVARLGTPASELPVSGAVEPSRETPLYARTSGYVKNWSVDLGDKVTEGQVLAELDTPEVDHQLVQARASADQAKAQVELAQNEADRWAKMVSDHAVSQTDADAKVAALNEAKANFNAAQANVARLADLEMFKQIRAPYAGTISARNLEVGTLVGAGPQGKELFRVTQTDPVRVFVNVPEASAPSVHPGVEARVEVAAYPGRVFGGAVVRDAGTLDPTTHALRTEVHVSNPDGSLLPGTLAKVKLEFVDPSPALLVPATSVIMISGKGAFIARLVSSDGRETVRMVPVHIGRTFGDEVELLDQPINSGDRLVADPPSDLRDGMIVNAQPLDQAILQRLRPPHPSEPRA